MSPLSRRAGSAKKRTNQGWSEGLLALVTFTVEGTLNVLLPEWWDPWILYLAPSLPRPFSASSFPKPESGDCCHSCFREMLEYSGALHRGLYLVVCQARAVCPGGAYRWAGGGHRVPVARVAL